MHHFPDLPTLPQPTGHHFPDFPDDLKGVGEVGRSIKIKNTSRKSEMFIYCYRLDNENDVVINLNLVTRIENLHPEETKTGEWRSAGAVVHFVDGSTLIVSDTCQTFGLHYENTERN